MGLGLTAMVLLTALGGARRDEPWGEAPAAREDVRRIKGPSPRYLERHDAIMEAQDVLGMWQRESLEFVEEAEELERLRGPGVQIFRGEPRDPQSDPEEADEAPEEDEGGRVAGKAPPPEDATQAPRGDDWLEQELARREATRQAKLEKSKEELEKERLWNEAAQKRAAERNAAIEAEARRMQDELNKARRREEEKRARQMGGKLDREGNFVDPDLAEEEEE